MNQNSLIFDVSPVKSKNTSLHPKNSLSAYPNSKNSLNHYSKSLTLTPSKPKIFESNYKGPEVSVNKIWKQPKKKLNLKKSLSINLDFFSKKENQKVIPSIKSLNKAPTSKIFCTDFWSNGMKREVLKMGRLDAFISFCDYKPTKLKNEEIDLSWFNVFKKKSENSKKESFFMPKRRRSKSFGKS